MVVDEWHELETRHQLALEAARLGLWTWDARSNAFEWDERAREVLGVGPEGLTAQSFAAAVHPNDRVARDSTWAAALNPKGSGTYQAEFRFVRPKDGQLRWISSSGRTQFKDSMPVRVVGVMRDVTERREAEATLRETATRFAGIVSIAADAIISIDEQQRITLFNDGAEKIFGYTRDEAIGQPLSMLLPEKFRGSHADHIRSFGGATVSARRMGERGEILGHRKNGETFFAEASISKLDVGGARVYTAVLRDITARRDAARQLLQSKKVLEIALDVGQIGIFEHDHDRDLLSWSPTLRTMCGFPDDRPIELSTYLALIPDEDRKRVGDAIAKAHDPSGDGAFYVEHPILRPDGARRWLSIRSHTSFAEGKAVSTIGAVLDITERKQSHAVLEEKINAGTRELRLEMRRREESQAQLVRTQRMEAFGQLTGGIAHDFNNLLTVITGNLELLEMRLKEDKERVLLKRAQDAAEMGARLTGRLLTFARRRRFEATALNLNEQVIGMAELLERALGEPITLTTVLERTPWTVMADPSEIENAILNLAINSRDAMPNGGKLIIETANITVEADEVGGESKLPAGDYVRLSVSDTGVGMGPEILQKAFEPFFTTKEPGKGTGLGLSTIYGFVQQANGALTMYSEIGRGTTVNLYLPQAERRQGGTGSKPNDDVLPLSAGERVLLVEDNPEVREVTRSQLEALGYIVVETSSGPAALDVLKDGQAVDVVFSDVVMAGGMSGFDVARWVQTHAAAKKVLLASGYPDEVLRTEDTSSLRIEILRKPYSRAELARALRRTLDA